MKRTITLLAAGVAALAPTIAFAAPPAPGSISPNHVTGQPDAECEDPGGTAPSQSGRDPGPWLTLPQRGTAWPQRIMPAISPGSMTRTRRLILNMISPASGVRPGRTADKTLHGACHRIGLRAPAPGGECGLDRRGHPVDRIGFFDHRSVVELRRRGVDVARRWRSRTGPSSRAAWLRPATRSRPSD